MQAHIEPWAGGYAGDRGRPLVVTGDSELLDELVGLASDGGVEVSVAVDAVAAEDRWASAPLVVVGADQVGALARRNMPRRLGVILVGRSALTGQTPEPDASADGAIEAVECLGVAALHPEHVVMLPDARSWLVTRFAECRPSMPRHAAPVVAFVPGSPDGGASLLAAGVALAARQQGLATLLVGAARPGVETGLPEGPAQLVRTELLDGGADAMAASGDHNRPESAGATLAVLSFDRADPSGVPPDAMAAALRAARHGRDLVLVDLPHPYDDASRLALSGADRCYLTVVAGVRECAAAARVAAAVRRHCPRLALVVRVVTRRGLRPDEVAEAFDLPLAGVLPPRVAGVGVPPLVDPGPAVAALSRRLLAEIGVTRRSEPDHTQAPTADADEVMDV